LTKSAPPYRFAVALLLFLAAGLYFDGNFLHRDWREARRESAGIAPDPQAVPEAILQVYGARAWGWRGWFAIHTWVAAKPSHADHYTVYDVVGWRKRHGQAPLRIAPDIPDRYWFDARPIINNPERIPRQGYRQIDSGGCSGGPQLSVERQLPPLSRTQQQHLYGLDRPRGTGTQT